MRGPRRGAWYNKGRYHDVEIYSILHDEALKPSQTHPPTPNRIPVVPGVRRGKNDPFSCHLHSGGRHYCALLDWSQQLSRQHSLWDSRPATWRLPRDWES